jgi:hypothetical protein
MRRLSILFLASLAAMASYACSTATSPANAPPGDGSTTRAEDSDICPLLDAGPPPVCPEGCVWNGKECRKNSSIVMPDLRPDAGRPPPN